MSRYFFHIRDGLIFVPDEEGMECRTISAMVEEAHASARDMENAALRNRSNTIAAKIEVEDEQGQAVTPPLARVH